MSESNLFKEVFLVPFEKMQVSRNEQIQKNGFDDAVIYFAEFWEERGYELETHILEKYFFDIDENLLETFAKADVDKKLSLPKDFFWQSDEGDSHPQYREYDDLILEAIRAFYVPTSANFPTAEQAAANLAENIDSHLKHNTSRTWTGLMPLGRLFESFPVFFDAGIFKVVNHKQGATSSNRDNAYDLSRILEEHAGICISSSKEDDAAFRTKIRQIKEETFGYIPGRPQLLVSVGTGDARFMQRHARDEFARAIPWLRFAQFIFEIRYAHDILTWNRFVRTDPEARLPDGRPMVLRSIEIPAKAVLIRKDNGNLSDTVQLYDEEKTPTNQDDPRWFGFLEDSSPTDPASISKDDLEGLCEKTIFPMNEPRLAIGRAFETNEGESYDFEKFDLMWTEKVIPLWNRIEKIKEIEKLNTYVRNFIDSFRNAMIVLGHNLNRSPEDQVVAVVSATESILSTLFDSHTNLCDNYATIASWLTEADVNNRPSRYKEAKEVYDCRSKIVHGFQLHKDSLRKSQDFNLRLGVDILLAVMFDSTEWVEEGLKEGKSINEKVWKARHLERLLS